ncbi:MAG: hypothetical protein CMJ83_15805 [Planctomycetes bacterium]|nr:hypothetical protein [Planctomycetota bacterium]
MKRIIPLLSLVLVSLVLSSLAPAQPGRNRNRAPKGSASWAHDGKHVIVDGTWRDPVTWKEVEATPRPKRPGRSAVANPRKAFQKALEDAGVGDVTSAFTRGRPKHRTIPRSPEGSPGLKTTSDGNAAVVVADHDLWAWSKDKGARRVTQGIEKPRRFELAPGGGAVSYIKDFDLYITRTKDGETFRLSDDGSENTFYGELDWVYQEEVYGRGNFKATWWSGTGAHLAYMRTDEDGVDTFMVVDHIPQALRIEHLKYPKAGTTNPRTTLWIANAKTGRKKAVDLSKYKPEDEILIVRVGWTPDSDRCIFFVQNREQTWLDLNFADPKTGKVTTLIHENCDDGWVNRYPMPRWLKDGTFVWESERTGFRHYYRYDRKGKLVATISKGEWEARRIIELNEDAGWMAFYGSTPSYAIGDHAYIAKLDGSGCNQITKGTGTHRVSLSADGTMVIDTFQHFSNPGEQWIRKVSGEDVKQTVKPKKPDRELTFIYEQVTCRDGEWVDVLVRKPRKFDPTKKYPVWIDTYSGPNSPTVRDRYMGRSRGGSDWFITMNVNVRSASRRGMKYTKQCYKQFGVQELKDLEDAIDWLCNTHEWADKNRVGIGGWSYGGFMAAFALTHSKKFKCGVAGAGVYGWDLYDTIYTERYMAKPQNNGEGYSKASCVEAASNLHGDLLIVHGTIDDNVHMQNSMQFIHALQNANKQNFQFMVYPKSRHGVRSAHLGTMRTKFVREHL